MSSIFVRLLYHCQLHTHLRLRGKVLLKGRRPVGAIDEYDTDGDETDDDLSELQSIWTEKTPVMASIPLKKELQFYCNR